MMKYICSLMLTAAVLTVGCDSAVLSLTDASAPAVSVSVTPVVSAVPSASSLVCEEAGQSDAGALPAASSSK